MRGGFRFLEVRVKFSYLVYMTIGSDDSLRPELHTGTNDVQVAVTAFAGALEKLGPARIAIMIHEGVIVRVARGGASGAAAK